MNQSQSNTNQTNECHDCAIVRIFVDMFDSEHKTNIRLYKDNCRMFADLADLDKQRTAAVNTLQQVRDWLQSLLQCVYRRQGEVLQIPADSAYYYLDKITEAIKTLEDRQ